MAAHTQWPEINVPLGRRRGTAGAFWKWRVSGQKHGEINRLESGMLAPGEEISLGLVFCLRILLLKMSHGDFLSRTMTWPDVATEEKNLIFFSLCSAIESIPGLIEWLLRLHGGGRGDLLCIFYVKLFLQTKLQSAGPDNGKMWIELNRAEVGNNGKWSFFFVLPTTIIIPDSLPLSSKRE